MTLWLWEMPLVTMCNLKGNILALDYVFTFYMYTYIKVKIVAILPKEIFMKLF